MQHSKYNSLGEKVQSPSIFNSTWSPFAFTPQIAHTSKYFIIIWKWMNKFLYILYVLTLMSVPSYLWTIQESWCVPSYLWTIQKSWCVPDETKIIEILTTLSSHDNW